MDFCDLNPNICGMEAGCYPTESSYICICHDLLPADANNNCDRTKAEASLLPSSSPPHSNITDSVQQAAPTEGSFGSHQLLGMLSTTKQIPGNVTGMLSATKQVPGNITDSNNTQLNEPSNITYHSSAGYDSSSAIIGACVFAFILLSIGSFIAFVYKKHKGNFCWWLRSARRRNAAAISLSKCMQQYISIQTTIQLH
ncbi:uncharacterized protein CEXT_51681 [Caerostris extrusa]|uniref:EGF-like domain-containing protein n=1 Tax=Caerostris extrusa TaxID=172846 RepID=A0AAV4P8B4_CAEEX|nr:uncharacterized protein CEXT_51681 [Caerostris extrusa]